MRYPHWASIPQQSPLSFLLQIREMVVFYNFVAAHVCLTSTCIISVSVLKLAQRTGEALLYNGIILHVHSNKCSLLLSCN